MRAYVTWHLVEDHLRHIEYMNLLGGQMSFDWDLLYCDVRLRISSRVISTFTFFQPTSNIMYVCQILDRDVVLR